MWFLPLASLVFFWWSPLRTAWLLLHVISLKQCIGFQMFHCRESARFKILKAGAGTFCWWPLLGIHCTNVHSFIFRHQSLSSCHSEWCGFSMEVKVSVSAYHIGIFFESCFIFRYPHAHSQCFMAVIWALPAFLPNSKTLDEERFLVAISFQLIFIIFVGKI